jgi:hypothetical protein
MVLLRRSRSDLEEFARAAVTTRTNAKAIWLGLMTKRFTRNARRQNLGRERSQKKAALYFHAADKLTENHEVTAKSVILPFQIPRTLSALVMRDWNVLMN